MAALDTTRTTQPCPATVFPPRQPNRTGPPHTQSLPSCKLRRSYSRLARQLVQALSLSSLSVPLSLALAAASPHKTTAPNTAIVRPLPSTSSPRRYGWRRKGPGSASLAQADGARLRAGDHAQLLTACQAVCLSLTHVAQSRTAAHSTRHQHCTLPVTRHTLGLATRRRTLAPDAPPIFRSSCWTWRGQRDSSVAGRRRQWGGTR